MNKSSQWIPPASTGEHNPDAATAGSRMSEGNRLHRSFGEPQSANAHSRHAIQFRIHLSVEWRYVVALAAGIGFVLCLLVALMLWISGPTAVGVDSNLVTARMLRRLVETVGHGGGLLNENSIAEAI